MQLPGFCSDFMTLDDVLARFQDFWAGINIPDEGNDDVDDNDDDEF